MCVSPFFTFHNRGKAMKTQSYCKLQLERLDDRITPSNVAAPANFGNLVSALNNITAQVDHVNALNNIDINHVRVVNVNDVLNGNNVQALNNALNRNNVNVLTDNLNNSLNNFSILDQALNNNQTSISDVVAVNVLSGGDIILFHQ